MAYTNRYFACPFYRGNYYVRENGHYRVNCEGGCRVSLPDAAAFDKYTKTYCCGDWALCSIAKVKTDFYARMEDAENDAIKENRNASRKN